MTLFTKYLPLEAATRLWDRYLIDPGRSHVFQIALGILAACEKVMLGEQLAGCLQALHKLPMDKGVTEEAVFAAIDTAPRPAI